MSKLFNYSFLLCALFIIFSCKEEKIAFPNTNDSILLNIDIDNKDTKGTPINSVDSDNFDEIGVYAKNTSGEYYINNQTATKGTQYWSFDQTYYWPDNSTELTFLSYYPLPTQTNGITISENTDGVPEITYTVPHSVQDQPDLMIAQTVENIYKEPVNLTFFHALSCIAFDLTSEENDQIKSIGIKGVYTTGKISLSFAGETFNWESLSGDDYIYNIGLAENPQPVEPDQTSSIMAPDGYLMMIPQAISDDAQIIVEFVNIGTKTIALKLDNLSEWQPGYIYTYMLREGKYVFDVTSVKLTDAGIPTDTVDVAGGTYNININSYYQNNGISTVDLGWSVSIESQTMNYNWTTTDIEGTLSDNVGGINISKAITCATSIPASITSTQSFVDTLRARPVITLDNAKDLSEYITGLYASANCYIVNQPGWHKFPCWVMGNGLSSLSTSSSPLYGYTKLNVSCFNSSTKNYKGEVISDTSALKLPTENASVQLLWQSPFEMITDLYISEDNQYIYFNVDQATIAPGNAVVAIKDENGVIMWSWHLWISPWTHVIYPNNGNRIFYGLSIGTSFPQQYTYEQNEIKLKFTQNNSGLTKEVILVQKPDTIKIGLNNTYYQWGRKDPMLPADGLNSNNDVMVEPSVSDAIQFSSSGYSVESSIQNPTTFYTGSGYDPSLSYWYHPYSDNKGYYKSIYDPSPIGSVVPLVDSSYEMQVKSWEPAYPGLLFKYVSGTVVFMPLGQRLGSTGALNNTSDSGYYWNNQQSNSGYSVIKIDNTSSDVANDYLDDNWLSPDYGLSVMSVVDFAFFFGE